MVDRYARDALPCYGRLRQLDEAQARAELGLFDDLLVIEGLTLDWTVRRPGDDHQPSAVLMPHTDTERNRPDHLTVGGTDG